MPLPPYLTALFDHLHWADALMWRTILSTPALHGDRRIYELLFHIHQVQHAMLSVWRGEKAHFDEFDAYPDLPAVAKWAREFHAQLPDFLAGVTEEQLNDVREVSWRKWVIRAIGGEPATTTLGELMMQTSQHSTYHRAQVNLRIREAGVDPPLTDFIAWCWRGKPAPEWRD